MVKLEIKHENGITDKIDVNSKITFIKLSDGFYIKYRRVGSDKEEIMRINDIEKLLALEKVGE